MAKRTRYSRAFKAKFVQKMLASPSRTLRTLAHEAGIPESTLCGWRMDATLRAVTTRRPDGETDGATDVRLAHEWTAEEKLAIVLESARVPEAEMGAYLRSKGVYEAQLTEWRQQALAGLGGSAERKAAADERRRVRALEQELKRKDKALAETAALLVLKKKVQEIWGDGDDGTAPSSE